MTDCRTTPSTTNSENKETVDAPGNDGNGSMPEQVKRPNPWVKIIIIIIIIILQCKQNVKKRDLRGSEQSLTD